MAEQIKPSVTNPTIADVYSDIKSDKLILRPDFQRRFVWTTDHQSSFIETIIKGFPFPEIYVCTGEMNVETFKSTRLVIDGQQRLTTISNYISGIDSNNLKVPSYDKLSNDQKKAFLGYQIVVRDLGSIDEETTREVFRRINLTKFSLDSIEVHNAVYDGHFISSAKKILNSIELEKFGILKESEFTRMADLHLILLFMSTFEHNGYFGQDKEVERYIAKYNNEYEDKKNTVSTVKSSINLIESLNLEPSSMWFRKSNFFTLVMEICFNLDKINDKNKLRQKLIELESFVMRDKNNPSTQFGKYYSYMYQATHGRAARATRGSTVRDFCIL